VFHLVSCYLIQKRIVCTDSHYSFMVERAGESTYDGLSHLRAIVSQVFHRLQHHITLTDAIELGLVIAVRALVEQGLTLTSINDVRGLTLVI